MVRQVAITYWYITRYCRKWKEKYHSAYAEWYYKVKVKVHGLPPQLVYILTTHTLNIVNHRKHDEEFVESMNEGRMIIHCSQLASASKSLDDCAAGWQFLTPQPVSLSNTAATSPSHCLALSLSLTHTHTVTSSTLSRVVVRCSSRNTRCNPTSLYYQYCVRLWA